VVVGDRGRTTDLKSFIDWAIDHPGVLLGDDLAGPHDFMPTLRVEPARWELFLDAIGDVDYSSALRCYINWRIQNPDAPLPGRRVPPFKRSSRRPLACV
jgi:hypothetical protein